MALSAIVALGVVFTLAIGLLTLGHGTLMSGQRQLKARGARAMTEAGIEYGYWQFAFTGVPLPYTATRTLGDGSFTTTVTTNYATIPNSVQIASTGTLKGESYSMTRVLKDLGPFDYAVCTNTGFSTNSLVVTGSGGANGRIRANGNIALGNVSTVINGNVTASGTISVTSVTGSKAPGAPTLPFPTTDLAYYESIANRKFYTNQKWNGFTFQVPNEVVFVDGDIALATGTISGRGTLVATQKIKFDGTVSYALSTDKLAGIAYGGFDTISAGSVSTVGIYYSSDSSKTGKLNLTKALTITQGSIAVDGFSISSGGSLNVTRDPEMSATLGKQLHLPGY